MSSIKINMKTFLYPILYKIWTATPPTATTTQVTSPRLTTTTIVEQTILVLTNTPSQKGSCIFYYSLLEGSSADISRWRVHFIIQEVKEEGSGVQSPSHPNHRDHTGAWQRMDSTIDICELDGLICQAGYGPKSQPKHSKLIL